MVNEFFKLIKTNDDINEKLEKFYQLHIDCPFNLTTIKDKDEFYLKHYLDSIYIFQQSEEPKGRLADIGSGGGFPGIVIGIFYPDLKITLIESISKKCKFLEESIQKLNLENISVINDRVENIKENKYDIITARGVATVKDVLKNSIHLSKKNTKWIMYKGEKLDEELSVAKQLFIKRNLYVEKIRIENPITRSYCIINYR